MVAIARALTRALYPQSHADDAFQTIVAFAGLGLVVSLVLASAGLDLGIAGF